MTKSANVTKPARRASLDPALAYSVEDAAGLLGIGRTTMLDLIAAGEIKSFLVKRRRLVSRAALEAFVARQERKA